MIWSRAKRDIMDFLIKLSPCASANSKTVGLGCGKKEHLASSWASVHLKALWAEGYVSAVARGYRATLEGKRARGDAPKLRD